jgi:hypothetical protein
VIAVNMATKKNKVNPAIMDGLVRMVYLVLQVYLVFQDNLVYKDLQQKDMAEHLVS